MTLRLNGNLDALKVNDDALPWDAATDYHFYFNGTVPNGFVATTTTGTPYTTAAQTYGVVAPEPAAGGLLVLLLGAGL